jgi:hypothetical protein
MISAVILLLMSEDSEHDAADAELARDISDWLTAQVFDVELETATVNDLSRETVSPPPSDVGSKGQSSSSHPVH